RRGHRPPRLRRAGVGDHAPPRRGRHRGEPPDRPAEHGGPRRARRTGRAAAAADPGGVLADDRAARARRRARDPGRLLDLGAHRARHPGAGAGGRRGPRRAPAQPGPHPRAAAVARARHRRAAVPGLLHRDAGDRGRLRHPRRHHLPGRPARDVLRRARGGDDPADDHVDGGQLRRDVPAGALPLGRLRGHLRRQPDAARGVGRRAAPPGARVLGRRGRAMIPAAPPQLDPDEARARLLEELSKSEYDDSPGFIQWLLGALERWLLEVLDGIDGSSTAQAGLAVLLVLVLAVAVFLVLRRTGLIRRSHALSVTAHLDADPVVSAAQLRREAREAGAAGRTDDGTVLALRALVRDLEERTLLEVSAGMTAHEAADQAARSFPELRGRLLRGADAFDTAAYSHRPATA